MVAKFSAVFSMFTKLLTQFGLMAFFTNYFWIFVSEVGCDWPHEIYAQMSKHKFFMRGHCLGKLSQGTGQGENFSSIYVQGVCYWTTKCAI